MTEKPNSVCKHCDHPPAVHDCLGCAMIGCACKQFPFEPVAEPAERRSPDRTTALDVAGEIEWVKSIDAKNAAPQPVAGEGTGAWRKLPVGHWFFLDSPVCTNRYSVQERTDSGCTLVCSTPWHHDGAKTDMQRIADLHNSLADGTPKMEEIARLLYAKAYKPADDDKGDFDMVEAANILRPFITPACSPGNAVEALAKAMHFWYGISDGSEEADLNWVWNNSDTIKAKWVPRAKEFIASVATPASTGEAQPLKLPDELLGGAVKVIRPTDLRNRVGMYMMEERGVKMGRNVDPGDVQDMIVEFTQREIEKVSTGEANGLAQQIEELCKNPAYGPEETLWLIFSLIGPHLATSVPHAEPPK